jgi:hypothetical protein
VLTTLLVVLGGVGTLATGAKSFIAALKETLKPIFGITAVGAIWLASAAGAVATLATVAVFYWKRCLEDPDRQPACSAGVINSVVNAFSSAADELFPFSAMHDRADVVVKSVYWFLVEANAQLVDCAQDADQSPIIRCYYRTDEVCSAGLGATIGGTAGAVGGVLLGAIAGAAIGCVTILFCILALLAALVVAAASVLAGAFVGGQLGKMVSGRGGGARTALGETLVVGDYVTTSGGLVTLGEADGARVYWFVDHTVVHGRSAGNPEFSFRDPDANLNPDACPSVIT